MDLHTIIPLGIALAVAALTIGLALTDAVRVRRAHRMVQHTRRGTGRDDASERR